MGRRSRKSKRKLNSMFMALLLTAILLIMSTYAWFTANRVVTINGIKARVTVAEGLQISLDGANWSNAITVDATTLAALDTVSNTEGNQTININNWQWPSELKPVSTDATLGDSDHLPLFKDGTISTDGLRLSSINAVTPSYNSGTTAGSGTKIIIFDVYLRNTSGSTGTDTFQLATGSSVAVGAAAEGGVQGTGLENSSRVGILLYGNTVSTAAQNQFDICNIGLGTPKFAIWEPNYASHISDTVSMDARLNTTSDEFQTRAIARGSASTINDVVDVENENSTDLKAVKTTHTTGGSLGGDVNLIDANVAASDTALTLARNAVSKVKIYIWLEGQDPDCNDYASAGGQLDYILKFTKPAPGQGGNG